MWPIFAKIGSFLGSAAGQGLMSGAAGLIQSRMANKQAQENTDKTIEANKYMAEYAYNKDLEMWNLQNQYNSPEMQMRRLKSAGLNPNLIYGSSSVVGNVSGSMPQYQAPRQEYNYESNIPDVGKIMQDYQQRKVQDAQVDMLKQQKENANQKLINDALTNSLMKADLKSKLLNIDQFEKTRGYSEEQMRLLNNKTTLELQNMLKTGENLSLETLSRELGLEDTRVGIDLKKEQIKGSRVERDRTYQDTIRIKLENEMRSMGLTPSDALWQRVLARLVNGGERKIPKGNDPKALREWINKQKQ